AAEHQQQYRHLGRSSSSTLRDGGGGWAEVSATEVKSAASFSPNYYPPAPSPHHDAVYPPSIHNAVLSQSPSTAATPPHTHGNPRCYFLISTVPFCPVVIVTAFIY
uniref:Uncharacterized protein n=1 Tax=Aegilops tauschii subsp. strangulata TaxID=200361 RepID=A0A453AVT5_AEGTS